MAVEAAPARIEGRTSHGGQGLSSARVQLWCIWCIPAVLAFLFGGMLLADFVPPPAPSLSASQVADFYATDTDLKRIGFVLVLIAGVLTGALCVPISVQLRRIPGAGPMAMLQLVGGALGVLVIIIPAFVFLGAAFRPERDPQITQALHDFGVIAFIANVAGVMLQAVAIGVAGLMQRGHETVFPRWFAYYNFWVCLLFLPGLLLVFFRDGAFAWNGAVCFWMVAVEFGVWYLVLLVVVRRAILEAGE